MRNNKWKFIGLISQVHDLDAKGLVFQTDTIKDKSVVRHVVHMHNTGKSLKQIDAYLLDADCTTEDQEFIVDSIYKHFQSEYEFRAVVSDGTGGEVQGIPFEQINAEDHHIVIAIGLYRNLNDGTQEHIIDIHHKELKNWSELFMGFPYKK